MRRSRSPSKKQIALVLPPQATNEIKEMIRAAQHTNPKLARKLKAVLAAVTAAPQPSAIDVIVCAPDDVPSSFTDDVHTTCADCGRGIYHRPYVPARLKKVCLACGQQRLEKEATSL
jgi:ribosomal protein L37E